MVHRRWLVVVVLVAVTAAACRSDSSATQPATDPVAPALSFVNRVWVVAESDQVALGDLRVFLSDGTMVMASTHAKPALGTWRDDNGQLTMTEDGVTYKVDILQLTHDTFRIRIHSPGDPVIIRFVVAPENRFSR